MKSIVSLLAVVLTSAVLVGTAGAQDQSVDQEVANAVLPLPEDLKADATVDTNRLAALATVANAMFSFDEVLNRR